MEGMRKWWAGVIYEGVLVGVLLVLIFTSKLTDGIFTAWLIAFGGGFATYVLGNVASKYAPDKTITTVSVPSIQILPDNLTPTGTTVPPSQ